MTDHRIKLTTGRIRDFTTTAGQAFLWDAEAPGLGVRATARGAKAFVYQAKLHGKALRITIGDVRAWSLEDARKEARRLRTLIDQGVDPRQEKQERRAAWEAKRRQEVTVAEAWEAYIEARRHKWSERYLRNQYVLAQEGGRLRKTGWRPGESRLTRPGPLYPLMGRRLSEIDADAVRTWLAVEIKRGPSQAEQAYRALRAFVAWCAEHREYGPVTHADACTSRAVRELVPTIKPKDDVLQREQLRPWFETVRRIGNPVISAYLQALLLTGARREELAGLRWGDVDFQWKSLAIHDKVEGERVIPLTPYVAHLLSNLPRRNEYVFSSPTAASGRIQEPRIPHVKALRAAGLPHVTLHGLRRSFGTLSEWVECPVGVVAQIMGHKPSALAEKHYRRRPLDLLRQWHIRIEAWILEQAGIEQPAEQAHGLRLVVTNH